MSVVKRGAYGFGGKGYGQSKPVMNYHTHNTDTVTTVVTEISRMTVNDKPPCTDATVKHATLEEVCEEKAGAYGTVQKHGYSEQKASYQHGSGVGGYAVDALHHDSTGAAQKYGYGAEQKAYQHGADAAGGYGSAVQKQHGYGEHQAYQHGGDLKGYTALHHESTVQKHGYGDGAQKAYQHGSDAVGGYGHDSAVQTHGYGEQKAYQHAGVAGGYGAVHHDSALQKHHGYAGEHQAAYQHGGVAGGYGAVHHDSALQKHHGYAGEHQAAYQHGGVAGGYGAVHHDGAVQNHAAYGGHKEYQHAGDGYGAYQQGCVDGVGGYDTLVQKTTTQKQYGYGGGPHKTTYDDVGSFDALVQKNAMQKQQKYGYGAGHNAYQGGCDGVTGYVDAIVPKQAYGAGGYALGHSTATGAAVHHNKAPAAYGKTYKQQVAGVGGHKVGALAHPCESEESDCSEDESDCEEELAYAGAGGNKPGATHQYSTYERRQQLGGGRNYELYKTTTTQEYSGGGYGW